MTTWATIGGGKVFSSAVKTDGTLWTWGANNYGKLGLGNTISKSSPNQVGALTNWVTVSKGTFSMHSLATTTGSALWVWGRGADGALGLGNTTNYSSPKQVGAVTKWSKITTGSQLSLAIQT